MLVKVLDGSFKIPPSFSEETMTLLHHLATPEPIMLNSTNIDISVDSYCPCLPL